MATSNQTRPPTIRRIVTPIRMPICTPAFVDSPVVSSPRVTRPSSPVSPGSKMAFPKVVIPYSASSTDTEPFSDTDRTRSPSLLTSLFCRQPSTCSTSDQATPVTPVSNGYASKPILRRPDCASTCTSASEDAYGAPIGRDYGLGPSVKINPDEHRPGLRRKGSTLTFAVKCTITSDSCLSPMSTTLAGPKPARTSRSPATLPAWSDDGDKDDDDEKEEDDDENWESNDHFFEEQSDSEDEGYEEDQEGGFTDDEDLLGTFTGAPTWIPSERWKACQAQLRRQTTYNDDQGSSRASSIFRCRERKVSIATSKPDHCSRHLSPPPSRVPSPRPCPPAASSPSALGLCRRREERDNRTTAKIGWRSDDSALQATGAHPASTCTSFLHSSRPRGPIGASLCPSRSILRNASEGHPIRSGASTDSCVLQRRVSAPAQRALGCGSTSHGVEELHDGARRAMGVYQRRGSDN